MPGKSNPLDTVARDRKKQRSIPSHSLHGKENNLGFKVESINQGL